MSEYLNKNLFDEDEYIALCSFFTASFRNKPRSEKNYAYDFNIFRRYIVRSLFEVDANLCREFINNTEKAYPKKQAAATVERIYSQLHRLYEYFKDNNKIAENPFNRVEKPAVDRARATDLALSFEDADKLLKAAGKLALRDKTMLFFLFTTGLKIKDFIALNWNQLVYDQNNEMGFYINKGKQTYYNKLHPDVVKMLLEYRKSLGMTPKINPSESNAIFTNAKGERVSQNWVRLVIKEACMLAGIPPLSPSDLRNSIGAFMLAYGVPPEEVALVLGYSDTFLTTRLPIVLPPRKDYAFFKGIKE
jgi:site-specific recombinase XerD